MQTRLPMFGSHLFAGGYAKTLGVPFNIQINRAPCHSGSILTRTSTFRNPNLPLRLGRGPQTHFSCFLTGPRPYSPNQAK